MMTDDLVKELREAAHSDFDTLAARELMRRSIVAITGLELAIEVTKNDCANAFAENDKLTRERDEARAQIESMDRQGQAFALHAGSEISTAKTRISKLEADNARLREALATARAWHESEDKALSKSGRSDLDYHWRRGGHKDQIADIRQVLPDEEYNEAWERINARTALEDTHADQ